MKQNMGILLGMAVAVALGLSVWTWFWPERPQLLEPAHHITHATPTPSPTSTPSITPTPDMRLYKLRQDAQWHVKNWFSDAATTIEELKELMGEPDAIKIMDGTTYWYYVLDPGKDDIYYIIKEYKVVRHIMGNIVYQAMQARQEATKIHIKERMEILELEKKEATKQLTRQAELEKEGDAVDGVALFQIMGIL